MKPSGIGFRDLFPGMLGLKPILLPVPEDGRIAVNGESSCSIDLPGMRNESQSGHIVSLV